MYSVRKTRTLSICLIMVLSTLGPLVSAHHEDVDDGPWLELQIEVDGAWETVDYAEQSDIPFLLAEGDYDLELLSNDLEVGETYNLSWEIMWYLADDQEEQFESANSTSWYAYTNSSSENLSIEVEEDTCGIIVNAVLNNSSGDWVGDQGWWLHGPCANNGMVGLEIDDGTTAWDLPNVFETDGIPTGIEEGTYEMTWTFSDLVSDGDYMFEMGVYSQNDNEVEVHEQWDYDDDDWSGTSAPELVWTLNVTAWDCSFWIDGTLYDDEVVVGAFWADMAGPCTVPSITLYLNDSNGNPVEYEMTAHNVSMDSCEPDYEGHGFDCHTGVDEDGDGEIDYYDYHWFEDCSPYDVSVDGTSGWECVEWYEFPTLEAGDHRGFVEINGLGSEGGQWSVQGVDSWTVSNGDHEDWHWDSSPFNESSAVSYNSTTDTWSFGWRMDIDMFTCEYTAEIEIWFVEWNSDGSDEWWPEDELHSEFFGWEGPCEPYVDPYTLFYENESGDMVEWEEIEHTSMWDHCEDYGYWDCYVHYDSNGDGQDDSWHWGYYDIQDCENSSGDWECLDWIQFPSIGEGNHSMELEIEADTNLSYLASVGVNLLQEEWGNSYWDEQNDFLEYFNATDSDGDGVGHHTMEIYMVVENHTCDAEIWAYLDGVEWDNDSIVESWMAGLSHFRFDTPCIEPEMPVTLWFEEYQGSEMIEYLPEYLEWNYPSLAAGNLSIQIQFDVEGGTDYRLSGVDEYCTMLGCSEEEWEWIFDTEDNWTWYQASGSIGVSEYDCDVNLGGMLEIIEWSDDGSSYTVVETVWEIWFHFWGPCEEPSPFTLYYDDTEWEQEGVYEEWEHCVELDDGFICAMESLPEEPEEVEIAFLYDMSGPIAGFSDAFQAAAEIAIDDVNSRQDAYEFSVAEYDSGCDGSTAAEAAQDIVDDGIDLVVGALCSGASMGANTVLSTYGIPHVSPTSTNLELSDSVSYPGFYRVVPSDAIQGTAMYDLVDSSGASDIALAYIQDQYESGIANVFIDHYEEGGGTLCGEYPYYSWETSSTDIAQAIIDDGCESLVLFSYGTDGADLITELDDLGFNGSLYGWEGSIAIADEISNLSLIDGMSFIDIVHEYDSQRAQEFWSVCENNTDCSDGGIYQAETFDAFSIVGEAFMLSRAFGISQEDSLNLVGHGWEGASSMVTFNDDGDVMGRGYNFCTWDSSISDLACFESWETDEFDFEPEDVIDVYDFADDSYAFFEDCENSTGTWLCMSGTDDPMIYGGQHTIDIEMEGLGEESEYSLYVEASRSGPWDSGWYSEQFWVTTGQDEHEAEVSLVLETFDWDCDMRVNLVLSTERGHYIWEEFHFIGPCEERPSMFELSYVDESGGFVDWDMEEMEVVMYNCTDAGSQEEPNGESVEYYYCFTDHDDDWHYFPQEDCEEFEEDGYWICISDVAPTLGQGDHDMRWMITQLDEGSDYRVEWNVEIWDANAGEEIDHYEESFTASSDWEQIDWVLVVDPSMCYMGIYANIFESVDYDGDGVADYEEHLWTDYEHGFIGICEAFGINDLIIEEEYSTGLVEVDLANGTAKVAVDVIYHLEDSAREKIDERFGDGDGWLSESEAGEFRDFVMEHEGYSDIPEGCLEYGWGPPFTVNDLDPWCTEMWADLENLDSGSEGEPVLINGFDLYYNVSADENGQMTIIYPGDEPGEEEGLEHNASLCGWAYEHTGFEIVSFAYNGTALSEGGFEPGSQCFTLEQGEIIAAIEIVFAAIDSDGDGYNDFDDRFPDDPEEWEDSDDDGVGDNSDDFPDDANETSDVDGDGVGDNSDAFPWDPTESADSDGDGWGDNSDAFPTDPTEWVDTDEDGIGDNADTDADGDGTSDSDEDSDGDGVNDDEDDFPFDANETTDTDGDGVGDNGDDFPNDANETTDTDGDGIGDNSDEDADGDGTPNDLDDFPLSDSESADSDGDGVGDNADAFPNDMSEWIDTDGDGTGNNADTDDDDDGTPDASDAFPLDDTEDTDTDMDGVGDNADAFDNDAGEWVDSDGDGVGDNSDAFPANPNERADSDGDGTGDIADAFPADPNEIMDSDGDGVGNNADAFPYDDTEQKDTDGDGVGDNADDDADGDGVPDDGPVPEPDDADDGGILPGFSAATGLVSMLGAAILIAGRRKD